MNSTPQPLPINRPLKQKRKRDASQPPLWGIYLMLALPFGLLIMFSYIPAVSALCHAFTRWDVGKTPDFIGLRNVFGTGFS